MPAPPLLRVNGAMLEVIRDGEVLTRYSLGEVDYHVRIDDAAVELTANGEVLDRYPLESPAPLADEPMTRIPVRESETVDHASVMFY